MTYLPILSDDLNVPHAIRRAVPLVLAALVLAVLGGCDAVDLRSPDAEAPSENLQVDAESFERADLLFDPVSLSAGETFSVELVDEQLDRGVTRITHKGTPGGDQLLKAHFDHLQPASVNVRCRNTQTGTQRTMATLSSKQLDSEEGLPVAYAEDEPTSYHYIDNGDNVIVEYDYDLRLAPGDSNPGGQFDFPESDRPVQCTHVGFVLKDVPTSFSPDGVRFGGDVAAPTIHSKNVR